MSIFDNLIYNSKKIGARIYQGTYDFRLDLIIDNNNKKTSMLDNLMKSFR